MTGVLRMCEKYLLKMKVLTIHHLVIAQDCQLKKLQDYCYSELSKAATLTQMLADTYYENLSDKTRMELIKARLALFEAKWRSECLCSWDGYHRLSQCSGDL